MKWLTASKTRIDIDKFIVRRWIARRAQKLWRSNGSANAFDVYDVRMPHAEWLANVHAPDCKLHFVVRIRIERQGGLRWGGYSNPMWLINRKIVYFPSVRTHIYIYLCVAHTVWALDRINFPFVVTILSHLWTEHACHIFLIRFKRHISLDDVF